MSKQEDGLSSNVIYSYTRKEAINDGVLIDVSTRAYEASFSIPVALTAAVWSQYVIWSESDSARQVSQDTEERLLDILQMLHFAIHKNLNSDCLCYHLYIIPRDGKTTKPRLIPLKAVIGGGDQGEPVITVMLPNED